MLLCEFFCGKGWDLSCFDKTSEDLDYSSASGSYWSWSTTERLSICHESAVRMS